jgi:hypothetical protein
MNEMQMVEPHAVIMSEHSVDNAGVIGHEVAEDETEDTTLDVEPATETVLPTIGNSADVAYQIRQVNQLLADALAYKQQASEAAEFYDRRIKALTQRADMLKENIGRWLKLNGMKRLATHSGTVHFSKKKKVIWCDDETLLSYVNNQDKAVQDELRNISPNKSALRQYIESTGVAPEGYRTEEAEGISIRKAA